MDKVVWLLFVNRRIGFGCVIDNMFYIVSVLVKNFVVVIVV